MTEWLCWMASVLLFVCFWTKNIAILIQRIVLTLVWSSCNLEKGQQDQKQTFPLLWRSWSVCEMFGLEIDAEIGTAKMIAREYYHMQLASGYCLLIVDGF